MSKERIRFTATNVAKAIFSALLAIPAAAVVAVTGAMVKGGLFAANALNAKIFKDYYGQVVINDATWDKLGKDWDDTVSKAFGICFFFYGWGADTVQGHIEDFLEETGRGEASDTSTRSLEELGKVAKDRIEGIDKKMLQLTPEEHAKLNAARQRIEDEENRMQNETPAISPSAPLYAQSLPDNNKTRTT